jgi:uncharacterized protein YdhG (YjbR/CyaY superfamily)
MAQIDDYLAGLDPESAEIVADAYAVARKLLPEAVEGTSYGMPALIYQGSPLLSVMCAKAHIGIYPYSPAVITEVLEHLPPIRGLSSAKGTIRLPLDAPVPDVVIRYLVLTRRDEIDAAVIARGKSRSGKATPDA